MNELEERIKKLKDKQEQLKAQQQKLIAQYNQKEKRDQLNRRIKIGEAVETIINIKVNNLDSLKTYISEHADDIRRTQS